MRTMTINFLIGILGFGLFSFSSAAFAADEPAPTKWPNGAKAAISLTYDDSLLSQLENAVPALDARDLKGTFYLTVGVDLFAENMDAWREVAETGHELGNHSLFHPCLGPKNFPERDWITEATDLDNYTVPRIVQELDFANSLLQALDGKSERTYAYPCGDSTAGGKSYVEALQPLVIGARSIVGHPSKISDETIHIYSIPTFGGEEQTGQALIALVDRILASGGYGTITFHGVGGDYLTVSNEAHLALLDYLTTIQDEIWVDTAANITRYIRDNRSFSKK